MEIAITAALILLAAWKAKQLPGLGTRGIVIIALLAALASAGRMALAAVPSVQPASFIVMMCGMALGGGAGLYCGIITAVLSSLLTSFGPWTIWQAALWGLMGLLSAAMKNKPFWMLSLYGLLWGFVFGWVMNLWYYSMGLAPFTPGAFLAACAASFPFDLAHGVTNAALLALFSRPSLRFLFKMAKGNKQ